MNRNRHAIRLLLLVTLFIAGCASQTHVAPANDLAGLLKRQSQEMMDAIAPGHVDVWRKYLHPDVIYMDENGVLENKETLLRELTPLPPGLVGGIDEKIPPRSWIQHAIRRVEVESEKFPTRRPAEATTGAVHAPMEGSSQTMRAQESSTAIHSASRSRDAHSHKHRAAERNLVAVNGERCVGGMDLPH